VFVPLTRPTLKACCSILSVLIDIYLAFGTLRSKTRMQSKSSRLLHLASKKQILRAKDVFNLGIPRNYLLRLVQKGVLTRVGRGLYASRSFPVTEHLSLIEAAHQVPKGVVCLLSALRFHKFTTQSPHQVWMAIDVKAWTPRSLSSSIRLVRMSGPALDFGVNEYSVRGGILKVYTPAKTVADCFKFRNKIGTDVAIEALRECRRLKKASIDELWAVAKICHVKRHAALSGVPLIPTGSESTRETASHEYQPRAPTAGEHPLRKRESRF